MRKVVVFLFLLGACRPPCPVGCEDYCASRYLEQFDYDLLVDTHTPYGIAVVAFGQKLAREVTEGIDRTFKDTSSCLANAFERLPGLDGMYYLPTDFRKAAWCVREHFRLPISPRCLTVTVPEDWFVSEVSGEQVLPSPAAEELCAAKGLNGTGCWWRAGVQYHDNGLPTLVTTPNLKLLRDPLIRIVTGCNNPWVGKLGQCAGKLGQCATQE